MLAIANLSAGNEVSESISLATASFDYLPLPAQVKFKESMEHFMVPFGHTLLMAYHASWELGNSEALSILEEALKSAVRKIEALVLEQGYHD